MKFYSKALLSIGIGFMVLLFTSSESMASGLTEATVRQANEKKAVIPVEIAGEIHYSNESELNFNNYTIHDLERFVNSLALFTELKRVEMCNTNLSNEQMAALCDVFPEIKFVWMVHCAGFDVRTDAVAFSTMFTGYGWAPETEVDFDALRYCTDLEALDIGHHSIKNLDFLKDLKKLKIVILAINRIEDISILEDMQEITYLELFLNKITDLSPLENLVNMEHLNLCHNKTLGDVEPILHYQNLQRLWISYCNLTKDEIARIRNAYPNARLEFDVYESVQAGWRSTEVYTRMRNVFNNNKMDEMFLPKVKTVEEIEKEWLEPETIPDESSPMAESLTMTEPGEIEIEIVELVEIDTELVELPEIAN